MSNTDSRRPLPIGVEFFHDMIERGYYYIDKTLLIKDIIDNMAQVTLFTRPRRFGKTLNMTMLKCFFEDTSILHKTSYESENTRQLFDNLNIASAGEEYMSEQGKYPVIFLTLKSAKQPSFESSFSALRTLIASEFSRHHYVFDSLSKKEKEMYDFLYSEKGSPNDYKVSLKFLSECLYKYHNKKVVIIIDEYDVPLETSYFTGFYQEMIAFIRSLFESALKTNIYLHFAILTGCLRISKESIFTGLNNLNIVSILAKKYDEYFGFTQKEVDEMFKFYKLEDKLEEAKRWYNGYLFGNANVYNPWSIIKITDEWDTDKKTLPIAFWASTSSNAIVKSLIEKMDSEQNDTAKKEIEQLISGKTIQKVIHEDITYDEIDNSIDNIWNFMYFTGYLTKVSESADNKGRIIAELKIPNIEVDLIFSDKIQLWFEKRIKAKDLKPFYEAILNGDAEKFEEILNDELLDSISYFDRAESFYHGFLLGLLNGIKGFIPVSNRENGNGRCDIILKHIQFTNKAVIFELKSTKNPVEMEALCQSALAQIDAQKYDSDLLKEGFKPEKILKYGIAFCGKVCVVTCKK
ncbi:MAG: ATP-binding protein [Dysgonamonadaceae bacterium]|jgi:hypothetical protein|nr:ATP-binding protein [Dysgonamonadaceae bacterium]